MEGLQARQAALETQLEGMKQPAPPLLHANMADISRRKVVQIATALESQNVEVRASARSGDPHPHHDDRDS